MQRKPFSEKSYYGKMASVQSIELVMGNFLDALFRHERSTFLASCSDQFLVLFKKKIH